MISFTINQYRGFPVVSDLNFHETKTVYSSRVQIALLSFGFGFVETHVRSGGVYLEDFEPAQILITIDGSQGTLAVVWPLIRELSLTLLFS